MRQAASNTTGIWSSVDGRAKVHKVRRAPRRNFYLTSHTQTFASELAILGLIVAVLQIVDGILTGIGMYHYGIHMEGNILLRTLMHHVGYIPALVVVKTFAIGVVTGLCIYASRVVWLRHALRGIIALYIMMAVLPWSYLLASEYLL